MKRTTKSILSILLALAMLLSFVPTSAFAATTTYHAYMGIQTNNTLWIFRNKVDDATYGLGTDAFKGLSSVESNEVVAHDGTFTDVDITADGTYTVTLENPDFAGETTLSQLFVSTDIPTDSGATFTDVSVKFDGTTQYTWADALMNPEEKTYNMILLQNIWNKDATDLFFYPMPFSKCEITFTVSGLPAASDDAAATSTDSSSTDTTAAASTGVVGLGVVYGLGALATGAVALKRKNK